MDCEQIQSSLLAYLDGEVTDIERAEIDAHLAVCPACTEELARLQSLQGDLSDAIPAGLEHWRLSESADERIRARLRREVARRAGPRRGPLDVLADLLRPRPALVRVAIPLVAIAIVLAAAFFGTRPVSVSAQETLVVSPGIYAPDTEAALRVIVRERGSAQPIPDAEVDVRLRLPGREEVLLYAGRTDGLGTADVQFHVPAYEQDSLSADLVVTAASALGRDQVTQPVTVRRSYRAYLTSDKPLYRPGQTIHQRVLALDATQGRPAADRHVLFQVQGIHGERLYERTVRTSGYGIAATDYVLPANASSGTYRLVAALGDTVSSRTVTVGHYERPTFRVILEAGRPYYLAGEAITGQVVARDLHGVPLPGAPVSVRAYLHDPDPQLVATVQGRTNHTGSYAFEFGLPSDIRADEANLALEASVLGVDGRIEWAGRVLPIAAQPLAIDVVAEGGRLRPGVENILYLLTTTPDGAPVRAQLDVGVAGESYKLVTDEYGLGQLDIAPAPGLREVQVQVAAMDAEGRMAARTVTLSADQSPAQVLLRLDRATYRVGESIHLDVLAGQGDVVYLDVVHRNQGQTLSTHVARLRSGRAQLTLDVSPQMVGTLELHAYQVLPDGTLARDARFAVVDALNELAVTARPELAAYRPGDTARVTIDTHVDGTPIQSAVGIAVVDESVYVLEERAPGFAKLFFLLEASLLESTAGLPGFAASERPDTAQARAAQDQAARAAWAGLPAGGLDLQHSTTSTQAWPQGRSRTLGWGLAIALLGIPIALWIAVVRRAKHSDVLRPALWRTASILIGGVVLLILPAMVAGLLGLFLLLGETLGKALLIVLLTAWIGAWVMLTLNAWRRRDQGAQAASLLVAAYGLLNALMIYVARRDTDLALGLAMAVAMGFVGVWMALLLLAASFWVEKRRVAAGAALALALLCVAIVIGAGATFAASSVYGRTVTDPGVYAGPVGWLTGCAVQPQKAAPEKESLIVQETVQVEKIVKETVVVEKEVEKPVTRVAEKEVEKRATQVGEMAVTATPAPQPTPTAAATPVPEVTASPRPLPTAGLTATPTRPPAATPTAVPQPISEPPPPLLGQFVPETIYWAPEVLTDAGGHVELAIPLPDADATWRLTALASTQSGQVGSATAQLHVSP